MWSEGDAVVEFLDEVIVRLMVDSLPETGPTLVPRSTGEISQVLLVQ